MSSRKYILGKYRSSDIFNLIDDSTMGETKPKLRLNRSTLENTKEEVFNIGKEKKISRNVQKDLYRNHSAEKRKLNYDKIYGSDIFNLKSKSVERRKERHHMPNITNRSTFFEEMKNNEEYVKNFKEYTREKRGYFNENKNNKSVEERNIYDNNIRYIKKRGFDVENEKDNHIISRNKNNNELNFKKKHPLTLYKSERRQFIGLDECRENNCKINKQIQFESHIFSSEDNTYKKSKKEIQEINERINQIKNEKDKYNILSQPRIRVNRRKRNSNENIFSSMDDLHKKIPPADMKWDSLQSQVMFSPDYTKKLYKNYGSKGPTAYQRRLHQFADSDNLDTLSGLKSEVQDFRYLKKPIKDEAKNMEEQKRIEKMVSNIPYLSEGKKLEFKMNKSILDFRDENEWQNKEKDLNDFLKKPKKKKNGITDKVNHNQNLLNKKGENNLEYHDYTITYGIKGNHFENYNENEIKNLFGKKGINVYDIHKNTFGKGKINIIELKISGNNNSDEINKKIKLIQDELNKKNYKVKIEKGNKSNNLKKFVNNPGGKIGIMKDNFSNKNEEPRFKIMPNDYRAKRGFTKQFAGINYSYKNPNQLYY